MAEAVGPSGRVFAVEAAKEMQSKLRAAINHCSVPFARKIVTYLDFAVSNQEGEAEFNYVPKAGGLSGLRRQDYPDGVDVLVEKVPVRRLDSSLPADAMPKFIKLDIEGAELHALQGGVDLVSRSRPVIAFEFGGPSAAARYGYTPADFFGFWSTIQYDLRTIFGEQLDLSTWGTPVPHCIVAAPRETGASMEMIHRATLAILHSRLKASAL